MRTGSLIPESPGTDTAAAGKTAADAENYLHISEKENPKGNSEDSSAGKTADDAENYLHISGEASHKGGSDSRSAGKGCECHTGHLHCSVTAEGYGTAAEEGVPILEMSGISASYGTKQVLHDVNLTVREGDFLGIIGPNGGGKTTLVKIMLGLKRPDTGSVRCFDGGRPVPHLHTGYLPQYSAIDRRFPITVYEVVLSGLEASKPLLRGYTGEHHRQVRQAIAEMELEGLEDRAIGQLSGGQLQRALLARAVVSRPQLLVLDEPDTYMDRHSEGRLYRLLEEVNRRCAIVLVSHDIGTVLQNVKSIACVNRTLHFHPHSEPTSLWLERAYGCPIDVVGHGDIPHRVLRKHSKD